MNASPNIREEGWVISRNIVKLKNREKIFNILFLIYVLFGTVCPESFSPAYARSVSWKLRNVRSVALCLALLVLHHVESNNVRSTCPSATA